MLAQSVSVTLMVIQRTELPGLGAKGSLGPLRDTEPVNSTWTGVWTSPGLSPVVVVVLYRVQLPERRASLYSPSCPVSETFI